MSLCKLQELFPNYCHAELESILEKANFNLEDAANFVMNKIVHDVDYELCRHISDVDKEKKILDKFQSAVEKKHTQSVSSTTFSAVMKRWGKRCAKKSFQEYSEPLI